jgi:peptide/nickel transport system ATP-binding protein
LNGTLQETLSTENPGALAEAVLQVTGLRTHLFTSRGQLRAVDGLSFSLSAGETLAIVGESGCGKSMAALSILGLQPSPPARIVSGSIRLDGEELTSLPEHRLRDRRGRAVSMIFQEPMTALNPVLTIGRQVGEVLERHFGLAGEELQNRVEEMLKLVGIPEPRRRMGQYPHNLSGGMRQRVMIAMALACRPRVLIADEPTTALDVTIQAQILDLMRDLQERLGTAIVLITHDLGVVAEMADRVVVMYAGRSVEEGPVEAIFDNPCHPYTRGLLGAVPRLDRSGSEQTERLAEIPGLVPAVRAEPTACTFAPRCPYATDRCRSAYPDIVAIDDAHRAACWEALRFDRKGAA